MWEKTHEPRPTLTPAKDRVEHYADPRLLRNRIARLDHGVALRVPAGERADLQRIASALARYQISVQDPELFDPGFQFGLRARIAIAHTGVLRERMDRGPEFSMPLHPLLQHQSDDPIGMDRMWRSDRADFRLYNGGGS